MCNAGSLDSRLKLLLGGTAVGGIGRGVVGNSEVLLPGSTGARDGSTRMDGNGDAPNRARAQAQTHTQTKEDENQKTYNVSMFPTATRQNSYSSHSIERTTLMSATAMPAREAWLALEGTPGVYQPVR